MKYLEYGHYDIASNETEMKNIIAQAIMYNPNTISVFPQHLKLLKNQITNQILSSTVIDYPLGIMDTKSRLSAIEFAGKNGTHIIELVAPSYFLCNRKYDKFREEIKSALDLCQNNKIELRYILEYRVFTLDLLYKITQILLSYGIKTIYPSTGYLLDDINDNILASALINKKNKDITIIANGNIWNDKQADLLCKNVDLYGFKCHSINSLQRIHSCRHINKITG